MSSFKESCFLLLSFLHFFMYCLSYKFNLDQTKHNFFPSFHTVSTLSLPTGTSSLWAWLWTLWGYDGSDGWRSQGCEQSGLRCGSEPGPGLLSWGWWRSACCARHYVGLSARGPCTQRTPAWLIAKATRAPVRQTRLYLCPLNNMNCFCLFYAEVFLSFLLLFEVKINGPGQILVNLMSTSQIKLMVKRDHSFSLGERISSCCYKIKCGPTQDVRSWAGDPVPIWLHLEIWERVDMEGQGWRRRGTEWVAARDACLRKVLVWLQKVRKSGLSWLKKKLLNFNVMSSRTFKLLFSEWKQILKILDHISLPQFSISVSYFTFLN